MQSLHLNPLSSQTSTFPSTKMKSPGYFKRLNFISLNLNVCFFNNKCNLDFIFFRRPYAYYNFELFFVFTNLGSVTIDFPKQNPKPYLLINLLRYEQSLNKICLLSNFLSSMTSQSLNRVAQQSPLKRVTFLRKLYLQSH